MSQSSRFANYKNKGKDAKEMRAKRAEVTVELRKARRDEQMSKCRNISVEAESSSPQNPSVLEAWSEVMAGSQSDSDNFIALRAIANDMGKVEPEFKLIACQEARKLLSRERIPSISIVVETGLVPRLVHCLRSAEWPAIQFEAAWALTNIASSTSEHVTEITRAGAVPLLVELIVLPITSLVEQAVWALGNIAGDGPKQRDLVLQANIMPKLIALLQSEMSYMFLRNLVWTISNLCRNKNPPPDLELVRLALPIMFRMLHTEDIEILADTCWAISYLTDGANEKIQAVTEQGIVEPLVNLLDHFDLRVLNPALSAVGNFLTGNDSQTQHIIEAGALPLLGKLLSHKNLDLVKEATWTLSNILAGNSDQIQWVIDSGLLPLIYRVLNEGDSRSRKEAAWAITNLTSGGSIEQIALVVQTGFVEPMCALLNCRDWEIVMVILDGLYNMLMAAERMLESDNICMLIEQCGGLDKLELLQHNRNNDIYNKTVKIIEGYFQEAPEDDEDGPATVNGQLSLSTAPPNQSFNF